MNKTVNINLGGLLFHIDEDAYHKLTEYLAAVSRSLSNTDGQDEIVKDIEMRIAELISEKHNGDRQIISMKTLDEIIKVMGQPEDYRIDSENEQQNSANFETKKINKKLYRDAENGILGGVAAGLSHYFGIELVWLRVLWVVSVFLGFGFGIIAYLVLWIVIPKAVTTSEKLEMKGQPITIQNIEKKVREEFDNVSDKLKNADYSAMRSQAKTGMEKFLHVLGELLRGLVKIFSKIMGLLFILISVPVLIVLLSGIFSIGTDSFLELPFQSHIHALNLPGIPLWMYSLLLFLSIGIPFLFIMLVGLRLLIKNMMPMGKPAKYLLSGLWFISIIIIMILAINYQAATAFDGRIVTKEPISLKANDTLEIKFRHNDYFTKGTEHTHEWLVTKDSTNNDVIYSNEVKLDIQKTDEKLPYIQIEKQANGKSMSAARNVAEKISYNYQVSENKLILDNYLLTDLKNKYHDQETVITVFLPENTVIELDANTENFIDSDFLSFTVDQSDKKALYKVVDSEIKCLNCTSLSKTENDSTFTISVKVNNK